METDNLSNRNGINKNNKLNIDSNKSNKLGFNPRKIQMINKMPDEIKISKMIKMIIYYGGMMMIQSHF